MTTNNIANVDKNLAIATSIEREGICFFDVEDAPLKLHGIFKENGLFRRMPEHVAKSVSKEVSILHSKSAGGRVRFVTDSPYVAIRADYNPYKLSLMALTGSAGFDMYSEYNGVTKFEGTFVPPYDVEDGYEGVKDFVRIFR